MHCKNIYTRGIHLHIIPVKNYIGEYLNQRRIKMAHFNSSGSDTSNDFKQTPRRCAVLNLDWYKSP